MEPIYEGGPDTEPTPGRLADSQPSLDHWITRFGWLIPVAVALGVYSVCLNNFFAWDDFIWLAKAHSFEQGWLQIFRPEAANYFDPLIHLMFVADSRIAGLNHQWYQGVDLAIHAINSLLVYRLTRALTGNAKTSLYGGVLFAGSFAIADAVLWPSSRVDLVSTFFSLGALILFLCYLRSGEMRNRHLALLLFILALTAKATPLILPVVLFWIVIQERQKTEGVRTALRNAARAAMPFFAVSIVYVVVLKLATYQTSPDNGLPFNLRNIFLAFCTLFVSEERLNNWSINLVAPAVFLVVSALGVAAFKIGSTIRARRTGYCILLLALLPVLFTTDFKLATADQNPFLLLNSPSHRIYLASVGAALIGAGLLSSIEALLRKFLPRLATLTVFLLLVGVVAEDVSLVRERDSLWQFIGDGYREQVQGLLPYMNRITEGCQVGMINFNGSPGFLLPMTRVISNTNNLTFISPVNMAMIGDMDILRKAEVTFLFVHTREGEVQDKTQQFRQLLLLNRTALLNPQQPQYQLECRDVAARLAGEINELIGH